MRLKTLAAYLVGNRDAILRVAQDRSAVFIGALFVLSAGFAREYDAVDLRREPWRLALPFAASLGMASLLYLAVRFALTPHSLRQEDYPHLFRAFLGCFWMTAPLAWLYAIPYERFLSQGDAANANLITLGFVALYRVLLITRVSSVLSSRRFTAALFVIMLIADAAMLLALKYSPVPPLQVMGGVQLTDAEAAIQGWAILTGLVAVITLPIWSIGSAIVTASARKITVQPNAAPEGPNDPGYAVWGLALASLAIWLILAPGPQREQHRAADVDELLHAGKLQDAVAKMSARPRSDFPPAWDPAPRIGYGEFHPSIEDVCNVIERDGIQGWARDEYHHKLLRIRDVPMYLPGGVVIPPTSQETFRLNNSERDKVIALPKTPPETAP